MSEIEFQGREWAYLQRCLLPSPGEIEHRCAKVREERITDPTHNQDECRDLAAAMIETIFEDIEELERAIKRPNQYVRLRNVVDRAIQSLSWLLDDCDYDPHGLTFHDVCEYAGCTKPEIVRKGVISRLKISKEAAAVLAQCV